MIEASSEIMKKPAKILIVDDEQVMRDVLEGLLLYQGYHLAFAQNGAETFNKVTEFEPDLILLDVMMPEMDGFEVCRHLKADEKWRQIPIILITALSGKEDVATGLDAGADDFIHKPFNNLELLARVRSMLRIKSQYDDLEEQQRKLEDALELNKNFGRVVAQHLGELELLHEVGLRLMNKLDMDSVLALATQTAFELIAEAAGCVIHFLSDEEHLLLLPVVFLPGSKSKTVYPSVGSEEIARQALALRDIIHLPDMLAEFPDSRSPLGKIRSILVTPLVDHQNILGTFSLFSFNANAFEQSHQHILPILANQTAVAISKAKSIEEQTRLKEREKWVIRDLFQRYVSPTVVERLVDGFEDLALGGKRQVISVLFADIRSFTTFSENLPPEHLIEVLNQYLALAVEAILDEEGTLDKFMGDAVMAIFNAPLPQPDHSLRAVRAAVAMQQAIAAYNTTASRNQLSFGIGIHLGPAVVGNIGTKEQMNYTAVGDTVNLAKRLQEKAEAGQIILSQAVYNTVTNWVNVDPLGSLPVKGRAATVAAYRLISLKDSQQ